jgi:hypothetical protein
MSKVTKALKADLPALAELLRSKGKGKDTILAHINPREAALLKRHGGSGDINPDTGLPMFDDGTGTGDSYAPQLDEAGQIQAPVGGDVAQAPQPLEAPQVAQAPQQFGATQDAADMAAGPSAGAVPIGQQLPTGGGTAYSPTNVPFSAPDLQRLSSGEALPQPSIMDIAGAALGNVTTQQLVKALGLGGLGVLGARNANVAGGQNQQATAELKQIAEPYQAKGQEMIGAAQRGELTPQSQQAFQAAMAQYNQSLANRGGVGQQQVQMQMADLYNRLLSNQYSYGLQVAQIGDNIAMGAIKQGLTLDQNLQRTTQNFYAQLAAIASGNVIGGTKPGVTA